MEMFVQSAWWISKVLIKFKLSSKTFFHLKYCSNRRYIFGRFKIEPYTKLTSIRYTFWCTCLNLYEKYHHRKLQKVAECSLIPPPHFKCCVWVGWQKLHRWENELPQVSMTVIIKVIWQVSQHLIIFVTYELTQ
jgi:hypothetical protein